jgi:FixJ family two-component response regulator
MEHRLILHIVDGDSRSRAEQARTAFALGHHAEVYSDLTELLDRLPRSGIILLRQRALDRSLDDLFERLGEHGVWLPVIMCSEEPQIDRVVNAIRNGALDYLQLPLETGRLARSLARVAAEADSQGRARLRTASARRRVTALSKREREVLELLSLGSSNKIIARELEISPRTVEIHRANMMNKLRANHAAEAVRLWLQSGLETRLPVPLREPEQDRGFGLSPYPDIGRMDRQRHPEYLDQDRDDAGGTAGEGKPRSRRARSR